MNPPGFPVPEAGVPRLDDLAHQTIRRAIATVRREEDAPFLLVDATAGNGHDTLFLARCAEEHGGEVLALDIQEAALAHVRARLTEAALTGRTRLLLLGHEELEPCLSRLMADGAAPLRLAGVVFNLGFLPGSDKRVVTRPATTCAALRGAVRLLSPGGVIAAHMYSGHPGGQEECEAVLALAAALPWQEWRVLSLAQHNKPRNREWLLLIERLTGRAEKEAPPQAAEEPLRKARKPVPESRPEVSSSAREVFREPDAGR